jgi:putative ABC transport system ATP-binding protein
MTAGPEAGAVALHAVARGAEVTVEHVSKCYDGRIQALRDVSLHLGPGEFVGLTGPSGSGKSTLLQIIGSLDRPDNGRVVVDRVSVGELSNPTEYRRDVVGFVFQRHHLLPMLGAQDNVEVPLIAGGVPRAERRRRSLELLSEVGLEHRADALPSQLSGGERQRVAVARALANEPRLLLADEPTGSLDQESSARVLRLINALRERRGMTLLIVSHDPAVGERADRTLHIVDGSLAEPDPPSAARPGRATGPEAGA